MKTFPVKISYLEDVNRRQSEIIRAEIKFSSEISVENKHFSLLEKSVKNDLTERLQRLVYGDIETALLYAERDICMLQDINPYEIARIFDWTKKSIPKLTHEPS